ncbi:hypothetical protein P0Y43_00935 [Pseudomonas entomophila]|uniref:hypothetical protein n=1 Tax=Pseudomonas entomophila TaxID=312306 RepID=UPI0023D7D717|nr:hypothetical protein [Pseudomonas entomophila]MDF0729289.1 hypothetical protein [Pseudomonas entomophila]
MPSALNVTDLTLYRKRKQAQHLGRLMWALYAQQAGFAAHPWREASQVAKPPRQA